MNLIKKCNNSKWFFNKLISFLNKDLRRNKYLTKTNINPNLRNLDDIIFNHALVKGADQIDIELRTGFHRKSFNKITRLNIGDVQSLGQPPLTYLRQMLALVSCPTLLDDEKFPEDVKKRARNILEKCPGNSIGSYSDACGIEIIRRQIAKYIEKRDSVSSHWKNCIIGHGANDVLKKFLNMIRYHGSENKPGVLYPVPGHPLHSAILKELGIEKINYYLEEFNWDVDADELEKTIVESRKVCNPRAIFVLNPGNPTSKILNRLSIEKIIKFAYKENLMIIADEIYQKNVLRNENNFVSFKKVLYDLGEPYSEMELVSLGSISDFIFGENGLKSGYAECVNFENEIYLMLSKQISASVCSSVLGQTALSAMVNPPEENEPSYELFNREINSIKDNLKMSVSILEEFLNNLEGVRCNQIQGALYAFPQIDLPEKAIKDSEKIGLSPDEYYALELLNKTGILVIPGSSFGQLPGTYHIRLTAMPKPDHFYKVLQQFKHFHDEFFMSLKKF